MKTKKVRLTLAGLDGNDELAERLRPKRNFYEIPNGGRVRVCSTCGLLLKATSFSVVNRNGRKEGLRSDCKKCNVKNQRDYYLKNSERLVAAARTNRQKNPELTRQLDYEKRLKSYGATVEEVSTILFLQGGKCAICMTTEPCGPGKRFHVDHDHDTGKIRGLLCSRCNTAMGLLKENESSIKRLLEYVLTHKKDQEDEQ